MPDVLIADDHPLFRDALQRAVLGALPEASVHCADSVHSLLALVEQYPEAELLLLDLHMIGTAQSWRTVLSAKLTTMM